MAKRARIGRKATGLGAGAVCGVVALAGAAFACTPIAGIMVVSALEGAEVGSTSVTVGRGPEGEMAFCGALDGGGFHDGIHEGLPTAPGAQSPELDEIVLAVAPAACPEDNEGNPAGPASVSAAVTGATNIANYVQTHGANVVNDLLGFQSYVLGPDGFGPAASLGLNVVGNSLTPNVEPSGATPQDVVLADINFRSGVFNTPDNHPWTDYTFDGAVVPARDCMNDDSANIPDANARSAHMAVLPGGFGAAVVTVPNGFDPPDDTAGVCVHAVTAPEDDGRVVSRIAMAPITIF